MNQPPTDQQLWSWVDQDSPQLEDFLVEHPEHRSRVAEIRLLIRSLAPHPGTGAEPPPPRIPRFTIARALGAGGMGIVYEAWQEDLQRRVALKVLRGGAALDERRLQLFEREAKALARVEHPDIARIYEAGRTAEGQPWFVMELVAGVPLSEHVRGSCRERAARLALFARICDAVHHAHVQGVVHRDLKPGNVLVDSAGNPKVLDFGLARFTDAEATRATMDGAGLLGTLAYMSPEQASGKPVDARSDVYSLGVILYELLTDALPHDVASPGDALRVLREEPPRRPSHLDPSLRGDLETIALHALEKDPRHRCQSAKALADDVRRQLAGEPILSRPPGLLRRGARTFARHRLKVAALVLLLAALGVAAWSGSVAEFLRTNLSRRITGQDYAKASPFTAVRWRESVPEVQVPGVAGGWHELLEIEGVRAGLLVEFCKQTGDVLWRKRFDEDLVEVLTRVLGRAPGAAVHLKLLGEDRGTTAAFDVAAAPMTEPNRRAVWDARSASPFTAVRWNGDAPEVLVDGSWGELLSAEGVPAGRLVEVCKQISRRHWKDFFEGTPVDALTTATGRTPGAKVRLELRDPGGGARSTEAPLVLYTVRSALTRGR